MSEEGKPAEQELVAAQPEAQASDQASKVKGPPEAKVADQASKPKMPPEEFYYVRALFIRLLALVYFLAFSSYFVQALGLNGSEGITPAHRYLEVLGDPMKGGSPGVERYWFYPTCFWINSSDFALQAVPLICSALSLVVMAGVGSVVILPVLWFCYLSIATVGGDFMGFQWDALLLEAGFLTIFFADIKLFDIFWKKGRVGVQAPSMVTIWLYRLLIFKLMFSSGSCKLLSGDTTWWNLTALEYHYWTQPLPTPAAWLVAQLPDWFQKISCAGVFVSELLMPFLVCGDRRCRLVFATSTVFLQIIIMITGNYTFFNILTIALCLPLINDNYCRLLLPGKLKRLFPSEPLDAAVPPRFLKATIYIVASLIVFLNGVHWFGRMLVPRQAMNVITSIYPWCLVNSYGLFAVMTTSRKEIIVEGSDDAKHWIPYQFKFKPGDLHRAPPIVAPYQPRLDWQMWFAALGSLDDSPWFTQFVFRLLQGSHDVENLLESKPFPDHPPKFIRASMMDYKFSNLSQLTKDGIWWQATEDSLFFPPARLHKKEAPAFSAPELPDPNAVLH